MKILLVVKQKKNVDTFLGTIRALMARGHAVTLAVQERKQARIEQLTTDLDTAEFALATPPALRTDAWAETAPLLRSLADCLHYQQPALRGASKLQARTIDKLREELRVGADDHTVTGLLRQVPPQQVQRLRAILGLAEDHLPTDPLYDEFLRALQPDVVLVSPRHPRRHAALQLGQPEHQGPPAPAARLDVRLERASAARGLGAARLPG
jgi:hypothetical protein